MERLRPLAPLVTVVLLAGVTGCSQGAKPAPRPSLSPLPTAVATVSVPLPGMWTVHPDPAQGFSVVTPDAWDFVLRDSPTLAADLDAVGKHSPELQAYFVKAAQANAELRFVAADARSLEGGFAANANVVASDLGSRAAAASLGELSQAKVKRLRADPAVSSTLKLVATTLSGHPASRIDYELNTGGGTVTVRSYLAVVDQGGRRRLFELTIGAPGEQATSVFDTIAGSFVLFG
ncbi:MAG: hypothetical protein NVSMB17_13080 [Candidatus Dormibacteria bacterium]